MPGFVVQAGATVKCGHGGMANPIVPNPRVKILGSPTCVRSTTFAVAGCPYVTAGVYTPCLTADWMTAALRVTSGGQPVILQDSQALCKPTPVPLAIVTTQTRVRAQ